jgi:hypothetical protein
MKSGTRSMNMFRKNARATVDGVYTGYRKRNGFDAN